MREERKEDVSAGSPRFFCFGLGFSALNLAERLQARGWQVAGTTRTVEKAAALRERGIEVWLFDNETPLADPAAALAGSDYLLSSVPPSADGDPVLNAHAQDIAKLHPLSWVGYLSTTGVYGNADGGWVDEDSRIHPSGTRGQRRADAEAAWLELHRTEGLPVHLFRLAGIYGPGRNQLESLRKGKARRLHKPGQVFSRIHVDDIAKVLEASMANSYPGRAYNVCDDDPSDPAEVVTHAAELLGVEPPPLVPFEEADLSPMARSFYDDNKRVCNRRIKEELGVRLDYPDYRSGLKALLKT
ncbi:SDR family oxidoreductase [Fodinicurvata sediminis]|uniref:SDR family oxidoreductase n=1 Tax=Fodinicurvata sediminis TaxID=1121832 RepID=UPI0003B7AB4E|nr:SDR family oxidoreductase [Fodinicurvata sediminis]